MKRSGGWRAAVLGVTSVLGVGSAWAVVAAAPAQAHGDPNNSYKNASQSKGVSVDSDRNYDQENNRTTFTFTLSLTGSEPVSHVVLMACPDVAVISATGPAGADKVDGDTPKNDPSIDGEHVGIKFQPGTAGTYTIVFAGNIVASQFVIKDGNGHAHFTEGQESDVCKPGSVTPTTTGGDTTPTTAGGDTTPTTAGGDTTPTTAGGDTTPTTAGGDTTPTTAGGDTTPTTRGGDTTQTTAGSNPNTQPGANQDNQPATEVESATETNNAQPGNEVLGSQQTQPEAQANLPRTGPVLPPLLIPLGAMLVAFGSVAIAAGRRSRD